MPADTEIARDDAGGVMTLEQLFDFFHLVGEERRAETVAAVPCVVLAGGVRRYMREQVITWASLGGLEPRREKVKRRAALVGREDA